MSQINHLNFSYFPLKTNASRPCQPRFVRRSGEYTCATSALAIPLLDPNRQNSQATLSSSSLSWVLPRIFVI